ncbi:MAG: phage tail tape measure protein [Pseudomonadota bacterium]
MTDDDTGSVSDLSRAVSDLKTSASNVTEGLSFQLKTSTEEIRRMDREAAALSRTIGSSLRQAFDGAILRGDKLGDVMRNVALSLSQTALNAAVTPVQNALGGAVQSVFSGLNPFVGAAAGGAVKAFAKGGVVSGATAFPMQGGVGVMGEAGPEAIMPLTRGADGRLGVRAAAGGGGGARVVVNISTPDVESFRRSQSQVAAEITRAVRRGERNM